MGYLLALLVATFLAFTTVDTLTFGPALAGWIALAALPALLFRPSPLAPGFWPLAALAMGRVVSWAITGSGFDMVLVGFAGPIAWGLFSRKPAAIAPLLRHFGLLVAVLQVIQLVTGYYISSNLMGHLLLICLSAWLDDEKPGFCQKPGFWLTITALLSTTSKGAGIGVVVMLAAWLRVGWVAVPGSVALSLVLFQFRRWNTVAWRLECWGRSVGLWLGSPWVGSVGAAPWPAHVMGVHAHNGPLGVLAWSGVVGALLGIVGSGYWLLRRPALPRWAWCGLLGVLVHYLVDDFSGSALCLALVGALMATDTAAQPASQLAAAAPAAIPSVQTSHRPGF